jgi:hypothetical protein
MTHTIAQVARWSTRSYGEPADTTPMDMAALRAHLVLCRRPQSRAFRLRCAARDLGAFMLSRVISTLLISALLLTLLLRFW